MKTVREIKALFRTAAINTRPNADRTILADALEAGGLTSEKHPADGGPTIRRFLMESRMTRLAAAVIVITAVLLGVRYFSGTAVKAVEFSEILKAMSEASWVHATVTGFEVRPGGRDEQWASPEARIQAIKRANGTAIFMSEKDHQQLEYDPNGNTITVSYLERFATDLPSPATMLATMHREWQEDGARVEVRVGSYGGRDVQVQDIGSSDVDVGKESQTLTLYVDSASNLLYGAELKAVDSTGKVIGTGSVVCDYPPSGPQSIYDLGVPRDARILDKTPSADLSAVLKEYKRCKAEAAGEYIAVIVHQEQYPSDLVRILDVDYRSGRNERHERYFLSPRGEVIAEWGPEYREQPGRSLEPLLAWARGRFDDPGTMLSIHLYDGRYYSSISRDSENGWGRLNKARSTSGDSLSQALAFQAWPTIPSTARIIEDDYARQNGLICIEDLTQGLVFPNGAVGHPGRFLYYLDPARDYLCRRQVMEWRPNADWQQDKDRLKRADPSNVTGGSMVMHEITEVFQGPNGHWYPRVIVQKQTEASEDYRSGPMSVYDVQTIYLDVSPTFPDGIFDAGKLPKR